VHTAKFVVLDESDESFATYSILKSTLVDTKFVLRVQKGGRRVDLRRGRVIVRGSQTEREARRGELARAGIRYGKPETIRPTNILQLFCGL
jgi:ferric-dicitrate binding protein FerR (iron transport regulator)